MEAVQPPGKKVTERDVPVQGKDEALCPTGQSASGLPNLSHGEGARCFSAILLAFPTKSMLHCMVFQNLKFRFVLNFLSFGRQPYPFPKPSPETIHHCATWELKPRRQGALGEQWGEIPGPLLRAIALRWPCFPGSARTTWIVLKTLGSAVLQGCRQTSKSCN